MNKYLKTSARLLIFSIALIIALKLIPKIFTEANDLEWAIPAMAILSALFILEAWILLRGRKIILYYLSVRDKVVFFLALTVILLALSLSERMHLPRSINILIDLIGLLLGWLIVRFFGSKNMKEVLSNPIASRKIDADFEDNK